MNNRIKYFSYLIIILSTILSCGFGDMKRANPFDPKGSNYDPQEKIWKGTKIIKADYYLDYGQTLIIQPGTTIKFERSATIKISGSRGKVTKIIAKGTKNSPIIFTSDSKDIQGSISISAPYNNTENIDFSLITNIFEYCHFENTSYGIKSDGYNLIVKNCKFDSSIYGIYSTGYSLIVDSCEFYNQGINVYRTGYAEIINNELINNTHTDSYDGIDLSVTNGGIIKNNICKYYSYGIRLFTKTDNFILENNTMISNAVGINIDSGSQNKKIKISKNEVSYNNYGIRGEIDSNHELFENNIYNNKGTAVSSCGVLINNYIAGNNGFEEDVVDLTVAGVEDGIYNTLSDSRPWQVSSVDAIKSASPTMIPDAGYSK